MITNLPPGMACWKNRTSLPEFLFVAPTFHGEASYVHTMKPPTNIASKWTWNYFLGDRPLGFLLIGCPWTAASRNGDG
ncbi:hypothetical protein [Actinoplanes sp. TFC3]|uniref:hypothetical protein n=1 Tax=Actinoplanes sp. TFC3 TaxID=1710355 RepID=UPI00129039F3|nr:hypothetical protein [Actinoplanes sp. TFC3]